MAMLPGCPVADSAVDLPSQTVAASVSWAISNGLTDTRRLPQIMG